MEQKSKRIIINQKQPEQGQLQIYTSSSIDQLLEDSKQIIAIELAKYSNKVQKNSTVMLSPQEARVVQGYMEVLVKVQKELREADESRDLAGLTNEQLIALVSKLSKGEKSE